MIATNAFSKFIPVADGTIFELIGAPAAGLAVFIANQDDAATMVYKFQGSDDGSTWEDIEFTLAEGGTATQFSIIAGASPHLIKVVPATQRTRLVAHGDLKAEIGVSYCKPHNLEATPPAVNLLY